MPIDNKEWMDLEIVILSEIGQTKKKHDIPYMWNLKRINTNELREPLIDLETELMVAGGKDAGKGYSGEFGRDMYTLVAVLSLSHA